LHYPKVDGAAEASHRQLQSEDHVQLLALEPQHGVAVLGHSQRLSPDAEHKASHDHQPEVTQYSAGGEDQLANEHDQHVDNGAQTDSEHPVDKEAAHKAEHDVWPRVDGVDQRELRGAEVEFLLEDVLQGTGVIVAKIGT